MSAIKEDPENNEVKEGIRAPDFTHNISDNALTLIAGVLQELQIIEPIAELSGELSVNTAPDKDQSDDQECDPLLFILPLRRDRHGDRRRGHQHQNAGRVSTALG